MSGAASVLENAGLKNDMEFIAANADSFIISLETLIQDLSPSDTVNDDNTMQEDTGYLAEQLQIIRSACEEYDDATVYTALDRLKEKPWRRETAAALENMRDTLFLHSDFDGAAEQVAMMTGVLCDKK